jgi:hypothetical protein
VSQLGEFQTLDIMIPKTSIPNLNHRTAAVASNLGDDACGEVGERKLYGRRTSTDELEQEQPLRVGEIAPDLHPVARRSRCSSDRVSGSGDPCRRDRLVPLAVFHTLTPTLLDQPVAQANLFVLEQPAQLISWSASFRSFGAFPVIQ